MYPAKINSPLTELAADIDDIQTSIAVVDAAKLPTAPRKDTSITVPRNLILRKKQNPGFWPG